MKHFLKKIRPYILLVIGSVLALASAAFSYSRPFGLSLVQKPQTTKTAFSAAAQKVSEAGSTNEIVLMAIIIVMIVIIPIIWKRRQWDRD